MKGCPNLSGRATDLIKGSGQTIFNPNREVISNRLLCFPRITAIIDAQNNGGGKLSAAEVNR